MYDIITIGTATIDAFLKSNEFQIFKDPEHLKRIGVTTGAAQCFPLGGKMEVENLTIATGGGATNTAVTFARQGLKVGTITKVGNDANGKQVLETLKEERVNVMPRYDTREQTGYSVILISREGDRTILTHRGAASAMKTTEIPLKKLKSKWAYIVPSDMSYKTLKKIFEHFNKQGTCIAIDPSKHFIQMGAQKLKPLLKMVKLFKLNREEAAYLTGVSYEDEKGIFKRLDELIGGIAVMTDGKNGVTVSDGHTLFHAGTFRERQIADRTGAGDAFGSGFVAGMVRNNERCERGACTPMNIEYAIRLGTANATSVVEYVGAKKGILTKREFEASPRWKKLNVEMTPL